MNSTEILARLIAFPSVSADPNRDLVDWLADLLRGAGIAVTVQPDSTGAKANLIATIGPADRPGVCLSGHTDVVPVAGQSWTRPPFELTSHDGRYFGRGTADMKGFVACAAAIALRAAQRRLVTPLHLAFSYDEEVGCLGVRPLIAALGAAPVQPRMVIVGEPTSMAVATGHKGKRALRLTATGQEAHSSRAPSGLNAIHLAAEMIGEIRAVQAGLEADGARDEGYDIPYTTVHVGLVSGGAALNIVPNHAVVDFEIRHLADDDPDALLDDLRNRAERIVAPHRARFPGAGIEIAQTGGYPGLDMGADSPAVALCKALTGANGLAKVAFGTEGGLFAEGLAVPVAICGPGSIEQAHKPDEYVSRAQLDACEAMLERLLDRLEAGL